MPRRVHYTRDDSGKKPVAILRLDDGKANAMQMAFFDELRAALDQAEGDDVHSVILAGRPGFFSAGLDLKVLPTLSAADLRSTLDGLEDTMKRVFLFPKPVIAAASGHAIAGGMMLYLAADLRLAVDLDEALFGLNEAVTGLRIQGGLAALCQHAIPPEFHTELMLQGHMMNPAETERRRITHQRVPQSGDLLAQALARAQGLSELDLPAYAANKNMLREPAWQAAVAYADALPDLLGDHNPFAELRNRV